MEQFKKSLTNLKNALDSLKSKGLGLVPERAANVADFSKLRNSHLQRSVKSYLNQIKEESGNLSSELDIDERNKVLKYVAEMNDHFVNNDLESLDKSLDNLAENLANIQTPVKEKFVTKPKKISDEIKDEVYADIEELDKAFSTGCYRSAIILCGRILEIILHRKAFEVTGQDYLEKAPGMGLGKIIAKLKEKDVVIDPGLTQQIHLINQVRVFSVHKKQEAFYPSKAQAQATILYTMDVVEKLFR